MLGLEVVQPPFMDLQRSLRKEGELHAEVAEAVHEREGELIGIRGRGVVSRGAEEIERQTLGRRLPGDIGVEHRAGAGEKEILHPDGALVVGAEPRPRQRLLHRAGRGLVEPEIFLLGSMLRSSILPLHIDPRLRQQAEAERIGPFRAEDGGDLPAESHHEVMPLPEIVGASHLAEGAGDRLLAEAVRNIVQNEGVIVVAGLPVGIQLRAEILPRVGDLSIGAPERQIQITLPPVASSQQTHHVHSPREHHLTRLLVRTPWPARAVGSVEIGEVRFLIHIPGRVGLDPLSLREVGAQHRLIFPERLERPHGHGREISFSLGEQGDREVMHP